jgi:DNA polymerase type B, organellar and viral
VCLSKAFLADMARQQTGHAMFDPEDRKGLWLYSLYCTQFELHNRDTMMSAFKRKRGLEKRIRKAQYKTDRTEDPSFFNFGKHADVNRLGALLKTDVVVYWTSNLAKAKHLEPWHDFRALTAATARSNVVYYVIAKDGRMSRASRCLDAFIARPMFFASREVDVRNCFSKALDDLVDDDSRRSLPPTGTYRRLADLEQSARLFSSMVVEEFAPVRAIIFVTYCKNLLGKFSNNHFKRRCAPKNCVYNRLFTLGPRLVTKADVLASQIVVVYCERVLALPNPEHERYLKEELSKGYQDYPADQPADENYQGIPRLSRAHVEAAAEIHRRKRAKALKIRRLRFRQKQRQRRREYLRTRAPQLVLSSSEDEDDECELEEEEEDVKLVPKICRCSLCHERSDFDHNMSLHGPEQLCTVQLDIRDLLEMLGMDSPENLDALEHLCRLSVAAFDIESMTVRLDHEPKDDMYERVSYLGGPSTRPEKKQKPCMLAHMDSLHEPGDMAVFTLQGDDEHDIYDMFKQYWKHIKERHQLLIETKKRLARPIVLVLEEFRKAHFAYCALHPVAGEDDEEHRRRVLKAYRATLPGMLQCRLETLVTDCVVFSFYGSGYDQCLLRGYLVPYLFEKGEIPKLDGKGNKVSILRTRCGIVFRDVTKLLAPSTNLRNFGKLFNLEAVKAHFPFALLDSVEKFRLPRLPDDLASWKSDLSGPEITAQDVRHAQELFESAGCDNLGDYLKAYLKLDVEILFKATQEWRKHLYKLVGIDFVESRKYTISSLSNLAGGKYAVSQKHIGSFFPNNSQVYRLLREGMRG